MGETLSLQLPIIVEVLDRVGKVKSRSRVDSLPCQLGRSYNNDIIIDDAYISPHHLRIETTADNILNVTDLDSENGLFSVAPLKQQNNLIVSENVKIRIGHTDIRFRSLNYQLSETIIEKSSPSKLTMLATNFYSLPTIWLLTAIGLYTDEYLSTTGKVIPSTLIATILPLFIFFIIWAGAWSLASKIVTHRFYFTFHAVIVCVAVYMLTLVYILADIIDFAFLIEDLSSWIITLSSILLAFLLLYGHLRFSSSLTQRKTFITAAVLSISINALSSMTSYLNQPAYNYQPNYSSTIKSSSLIFTELKTSNQFFASTSVLKEHIDKIAANKN